MQIAQIQQLSSEVEFEVPLFIETVAAGFPSPADDFVDTKLDLNEYLVKHPAATFFVRVSGDAMKDVGIVSEDILIVDRSLEPKSGAIIIAVLSGEMAVRRLKIDGNRIFLLSENSVDDMVEVTEDEDFRIWGVVTSVIHKM